MTDPLEDAPQGAMKEMDLRAKFQALREFVETIPAEKLDMHKTDGDCRCVIGHSCELGAGVAGALSIRIDRADADDLFAVSCDYPEPNGQPAKDEFLRRLSVLEEKYAPKRAENGVEP